MKTNLFFILLLFCGILSVHAQNEENLQVVEQAELYRFINEHPDIILNDESVLLEDLLNDFLRVKGIWIDVNNENKIHLKADMLESKTKPEILRMMNSSKEDSTLLYFTKQSDGFSGKFMNIRQTSTDFKFDKKSTENSEQIIQEKPDSILYQTRRTRTVIQKDSVIVLE